VPPGPRIDIRQGHVNLVPEHTGKTVRVYGSSVDQHQNLVRIERIEAANADRPLIAIDLRHIDAWHHSQQVGDAGGAGTPDIFAADHENRSSRL
jgi:hypothetical protein